MTSFRGRYVLPAAFVYRSLLPAIAARPKYWSMLPQQFRRYMGVDRPEADQHVSQVAIRCTDVCDLRCRTCGQWGENGWVLAKLRRGEKLASISWETARRIIHETKHDRPFYYIWGGEPTVWKPLLPLDGCEIPRQWNS